MSNYFTFRLQRLRRRWWREIQLGFSAITHFLHFNVRGKGRQFGMIRRFALVWWVLLAALLLGSIWQLRHVISIGSVLRPVAGGTYSEALTGEIKTINPALPDNSASADAAKLIFSGLTKYDSQGMLRSDLATNWVISSDGKTYTFYLRKGVKWHDGVPFTAQDVLFTLAVVQNPDTRSPLAPDWKGIKASAPNDQTVIFTLPKAYTPFMVSTTLGILPRHLLENVEPKQLRVNTFNQRPVGTGPFKLEQVDSTSGSLVFKANDDYFGGRPLLDSIRLRTYDTADKALDAYQKRQVLGVARLQPGQLEAATKTGSLRLHQASVPDQVSVFFHTSSGIMADKTVRAALSQATNRQQIIDEQLNGQAAPLTSPLTSQGINLFGAPHQPNFDVAKAVAALESAGWIKGPDGIRSKNGQKLEIKLATQTDTIYGVVAQQLALQWGKVGAKVEVSQYDAATLQQSYIRTRRYDALLYGINIGADPDVYAYWHSSQATDPGLNLSSYASTAADKALEGGRTVRDVQTRSAKYRSFIQAWMADSPAIMLYSPSYTYAVDRNVHGIDIRRLVSASDRFDNVEHWSLKVKTVPAK